MSRVSPTAVVFILMTVTFTVAGQLLLKLGVRDLSRTAGGNGGPTTILWHVVTDWRLICGLLCAVAAALSWMMAIARSDLSFAYPFMALAIVLVLALSGVLLDEPVPPTRWLGVAIVCVGIVISSRA